VVITAKIAGNSGPPPRGGVEAMGRLI